MRSISLFLQMSEICHIWLITVGYVLWTVKIRSVDNVVQEKAWYVCKHCGCIMCHMLNQCLHMLSPFTTIRRTIWH